MYPIGTESTARNRKIQIELDFPMFDSGSGSGSTSTVSFLFGPLRDGNLNLKLIQSQKVNDLLTGVGFCESPFFLSTRLAIIFPVFSNFGSTFFFFLSFFFLTGSAFGLGLGAGFAFGAGFGSGCMKYFGSTASPAHHPIPEYNMTLTVTQFTSSSFLLNQGSGPLNQGALTKTYTIYGIL